MPCSLSLIAPTFVNTLTIIIFLPLGAAVAEWLSSWLAEQKVRGSIPGLATWIFRDWLSPAFKSRYGWKIAKSTLILKSTNQPTIFLPFLVTTGISVSQKHLVIVCIAYFKDKNLQWYYISFVEPCKNFRINSRWIQS